MDGPKGTKNNFRSMTDPSKGTAQLGKRREPSKKGRSRPTRAQAPACDKKKKGELQESGP